MNAVEEVESAASLQHLPSTSEALGLILSTAKRKGNTAEVNLKQQPRDLAFRWSLVTGRTGCGGGSCSGNKGHTLKKNGEDVRREAKGHSSKRGVLFK